MISHLYRCIYIHIPKTAGTSIEYKLGHFKELKRGVQDHGTIRDIEPLSWLESAGLFLRGDFKLLSRRAKRLASGDGRVSSRQFQRYFKFTFIRNPWARVFSWYQNVMRDDLHRRKSGISGRDSFEKFLKRGMKEWALKPQLYWMRNRRGNIPLDFIGRYESLERDFTHVAGVLGLKEGELPKLVSGSNPSYPSFYNQEMKERVAERYAEEIKLFGYKFGD